MKLLGVICNPGPSEGRQTNLKKDLLRNGYSLNIMDKKFVSAKTKEEDWSRNALKNHDIVLLKFLRKRLKKYTTKFLNEDKAKKQRVQITASVPCTVKQT